MAFKFVLFLVCCAFGTHHSAKLPNYVERCKFGSSEFEKCSLASAKKILANIPNGDKAFNIPTLTPLTLPSVQIDQGDNFHMTLTDIDVSGIEKADLMEIKFTKELLELKFHIKNVQLNGRYKVNGQILVVPIQGDGNFNITTVGGNFTYSASLESYDKKGATYFKIIKDEEHHKFDKVFFNFDNLFNGDKTLGTQVNMWLNENWEDVLKYLDDTLRTSIGAVFKVLVNGFLTQRPQKELFLE